MTKKPISKILPKSVVNKICHGDLLYFDDYRGCGLYVANLKGKTMHMQKTNGEYGYFLPPAFRGVPRSYWSEDENIMFGFSILDNEPENADLED